ncbi:MAG TPA: serine hydrolase domain-containing protein [Pyrinomonadaceae bacterium]|jgi:CubicO group peptidase (beta-lactamase class C family)|nr:serine hydrolase domain-containing protein [Pyrinomonadaceae bacterium]
MPTANDQLSALLQQHIESGEFPSAVYLVGERDEILYTDALGYSVVEPYRVANKLDTIYDLASLTKPLITSLLCARRIELGELTLDSSVSHYLPEFDRTDKQMITVRELLTHTSGLPAWRPLYILTEDEPERAAGAIANLDLEYKPGSRVVYSDLGFIALGVLLERMTGHRIAELARKEIFEPLSLKQTFFNPEVALQTGIAACETGNAYEADMSKQMNAGVYANSRQRVIWGEVHDGNAYFLGGAAGHAGLFSTASETFLLAQQFLSESTRLLAPATCKMFRENMTPELEEARSIGWQLAATKDSTGGVNLPPDSFGHNGFTGTCVWIDPIHRRVFILLTNRTHAHALPFANINAVRREFNTLAIKALG